MVWVASCLRPGLAEGNREPGPGLADTVCVRGGWGKCAAMWALYRHSMAAGQAME